MQIPMTVPLEARFAICVLQNRHKELLLLQRSATRKFGPGLWGFVGGHIEAYESPLECAWRELHEEIGPDNQVHFLKVEGPIRDRHYGGKFEAHLFLYDWHSGQIELDSEHIDHRWVPLDELKHYTLMPGLKDNLVHLNLIHA